MERNKRSVEELDVTAFLSLMVILLPILLLSAKFEVFSSINFFLPQSQNQTVYEVKEPILVNLNVGQIQIKFENDIKTIEAQSFTLRVKKLHEYLKALKKSEMLDDISVVLNVYNGAEYSVVIEAVGAITVGYKEGTDALFPQIKINMISEKHDVSKS